jgi:hypothetical protein
VHAEATRRSISSRMSEAQVKNEENVVLTTTSFSRVSLISQTVPCSSDSQIQPLSILHPTSTHSHPLRFLIVSLAYTQQSTQIKNTHTKSQHPRSHLIVTERPPIFAHFVSPGTVQVPFGHLGFGFGLWALTTRTAERMTMIERNFIVGIEVGMVYCISTLLELSG